MPNLKEAEIYTRSQAHRASLLSRESDVALDMALRYAQTANRITNEVEAIYKTIAKIRAEGGTPSKTQIDALIRETGLLRLVDNSIAKYQGFANSRIVDEQKAAVETALEHSEQLMKASLNAPKTFEYPEGWFEYDEDAVEALIGRTTKSAGERLSQLAFSRTGDLISDRILESLTDGIVRGRGLREIGAEVSRIAQMPLNRALTIARTEVMGAYRQASIQRYADSAVVSGWEWLSGRGSRTCLFCLSMDGKRFKDNHPFETHPNCRCTAIPVTLSWTELGYPELEKQTPPRQTGEEWLRAQSPSYQKSRLGDSYEAFASGRSLDEIRSGSVKTIVPSTASSPTTPEIRDFKSYYNGSLDLKSVERTIQEEIEKPVYIQINEKDFEKVLKSGRFKNTSETGKTNTPAGKDKSTYTSYLRSRNIREEIKFGDDKPVFGFVGDYGERALNSYGDVKVQLREDVKNRSTFTTGDSLDKIQASPTTFDKSIDIRNTVATVADQVKQESWQYGNPTAETLNRLSDTAKQNYTVNTDRMLQRFVDPGDKPYVYIEAQIRNEVSLKDIEKVIFKSEPSPKVKELLLKNRIAWSVD